MPLQKKLTNNVVNLTNGELIGGGSGRSSRTTLYTGNATGTNQIELTDSIENYDVLVLYFSYGSVHAYAPLIVDVDFFIENCPYKSTPSYADGHMIISLNDEDGQWGRVLCGVDNTHLLIWLENRNINMIRVDGIKF